MRQLTRSRVVKGKPKNLEPKGETTVNNFAQFIKTALLVSLLSTVILVVLQLIVFLLIAVAVAGISVAALAAIAIGSRCLWKDFAVRDNGIAVDYFPEMEEEEGVEIDLPEINTRTEVGEEEILATTQVEELSEAPMLETAEDSAAIPEELTKEEIQQALTFVQMKNLCRQMGLTGYSKFRNCGQYAEFLASQNLRRSHLLENISA